MHPIHVIHADAKGGKIAMETKPILFCNIGWMKAYRGQVGQADQIVGGGSHVEINEAGGEVCNFLPCDDGFVYGHVETIKGERDRQIEISKLGAKSGAESLNNVDVVWTATEPQQGGRHVVGWYRDATLFRKRKKFDECPSDQHEADGIGNYRVVANAENVVLLDEENRRAFPLGHGGEWFGQTPWWFTHDKSDPAIAGFVARVRDAMADAQTILDDSSFPPGSTQRQSEVNIRIGQARFSRNVRKKWNGCAVTGCETRELCEASHIKPWKDCANEERLDPDNGLLLFSSLHRAFDMGLIAFSDDGEIQLSPVLTSRDRELLGVAEGKSLTQRPSARMKPYLRFHRQHVFKKRSRQPA
jgi:hypothetical protein